MPNAMPYYFSGPQTRRERRTAPSFYPSVRKKRANMVSSIARYLLGAVWWRLETEGNGHSASRRVSTSRRAAAARRCTAPLPRARMCTWLCSSRWALRRSADARILSRRQPLTWTLALSAAVPLPREAYGQQVQQGHPEAPVYVQDQQAAPVAL